MKTDCKGARAAAGTCVKIGLTAVIQWELSKAWISMMMEEAEESG